MLVQRELGTFAKKVRRAIQVSRTYKLLTQTHRMSTVGAVLDKNSFW